MKELQSDERLQASVALASQIRAKFLDFNLDSQHCSSFDARDAFVSIQKTERVEVVRLRVLELK